MTGVTTSTIPAFKAALKTRLAADAGLAGVQVVRIDPFPKARANEMLIVARARPEDPFRDSTFGAGQVAASMGGPSRRSREERYVVELVISILASTQTIPDGVEDRAYELVAVVQQSVDAWADENPRFDDLVRFCAVVRTEDWHGNDNTNREARVTVGIGCQQRINVPV